MKVFFGWNSERPRKTIGLCCLTIARELPRGTHLPWVPTLCTENCTKCEGESESESHLGENPGLSPNSTHI